MKTILNEIKVLIGVSLLIAFTKYFYCHMFNECISMYEASLLGALVWIMLNTMNIERLTGKE